MVIRCGNGLGSPAIAFDSASSGADGAFNPLVDTVRQLPADGIFNFTALDIPAGVTGIRFRPKTMMETYSFTPCSKPRPA